MSSAHHVEAVVIGSGAIGLACARALAMIGKEVLILERESTFGSGANIFDNLLPMQQQLVPTMIKIEMRICTFASFV